jgi:hypothetical protein
VQSGKNVDVFGYLIGLGCYLHIYFTAEILTFELSLLCFEISTYFDSVQGYFSQCHVSGRGVRLCTVFSRHGIVHVFPYLREYSKKQNPSPYRNSGLPAEFFRE